MERPERERFDDICDALTTWHPEVKASKVFGMPCLKRSGRVIAGFSRTGMVFKLTDPDAHKRALSLPGAHLFDPSGRGEAFRQWVVVPPEQAAEWEALAYEALGQDHSLGFPAPAQTKPAPPLASHSGTGKAGTSVP
jgi:hypothetical protein